MRHVRVKVRSSANRFTRRELLRTAAGAGVGLLIPGAFAQNSRPSTAPSARLPVPWWLTTYAERSRVVTVRSADVLHASVVDPPTLGEMLDLGIKNLTRLESTELAWRAVLGSAERVLLKFNSVGAKEIATNETLGTLLVERIEAAGWPRERITIAELPAHVIRRLGCAPPAPGWSDSLDLDGRPEPLAVYALAADAIVNVGLLKTHQIAGMSCCMKNLAYGVIRHPARYHANGCAAYVPRIIAAPALANRLKLNIVNGLRIVARNGPEAVEEDIVSYGGIVLGFDPLAVDGVGWSILTTERHQLGIDEEVVVPYLVSAAQMGVGRWRQSEIDQVLVSVDG